VQRLLVLLPLAASLAACGGSSGSGGNSSQAGGSALQTIQISEKEYSFNPSTITVPKPGTYAFEVTNKGTITHAFVIEESGSEGSEAKTGDIQPGSRKTVKFTFEAGKRYEMYCPVDGHKAEGMAGTIAVGGAAGGGTTTNPEGETTTTNSVPGY
jgi:plastocyanin